MAMGFDELNLLQKSIRHNSLELGIQLSLPDQPTEQQSIGPELDPVPVVLADQEWEALKAGIKQRVRAFDLLLRDVYSDKEILRKKIIPLHVILGDIAYVPECTTIEPLAGRYISLAGTDLVRDLSGRWWVTQNHYSMPTGLSFMLQNRRVLERSAPEIIEKYPVLPLTDVPSAVV